MGNRNASARVTALDHTLAAPRCRDLCIYNWREIRNNNAAMEAIHRILTTP